MIGHSMIEGGGPSAAEVATSFPARLLDAIEELRKFSSLLNKEERRRRRVKSSLKKEICSCSARSGFYRPISA